MRDWRVVLFSMTTREVFPWQRTSISVAIPTDGSQMRTWASTIVSLFIFKNWTSRWAAEERVILRISPVFAKAVIAWSAILPIRIPSPRECGWVRLRFGVARRVALKVG